MGTAMKTVSIIIPVYNGEKFIRPCINALSEQEYPDLEVCFVVDHKTTDGTLKEIEANQTRLLSVKTVIQQDEGRLGAARNIGVDNTNGEFIWFLDVDDRPANDFLTKMVSILDETGSDVVFCNFFASDSRELPDFSDMKFTVKTMNRQEALRLRCEEGLPVTAWSKVYRRSLIADNGLRYRTDLAEDVDYTYRSLAVANKVSYYNEPLYLYYQNEGSICNSNQNNRRGLAEVEVYHRLFTDFKTQQPEFYDFFVDRALTTVTRSMVHMDYQMFKQQYRENWVKPLVTERNKKDPLVEMVLFKHFPYLYYHLAHFVMKKFYYKNNKPWDLTISEEHGDRFFSKYFKNI